MTLIGADDDDKKKFKYYATEDNDEGETTPRRFHEAYVDNMQEYYKERGIKTPEHLSSVAAYLEHRGASGKRGGGTRMPKKHIMDDKQLTKTEKVMAGLSSKDEAQARSNYFDLKRDETMALSDT